jgi:hypothetical protein
MTHVYDGGLRFVEAGDLDSRVLDLEDLDVINRHGDDLGELDGFLVDADTGRPRYVVIDSGGWFHSRRFAVPVSQAHYDPSERAMRLDLDRDTINRFPAFDDRFDEWTSDRWQQYDQGVTRASTAPAPVRSSVADTTGTAGAWWQSQAWTEFGHREGRADIQRDYQRESAARDEAAAEVAHEDFHAGRESLTGRGDDRLDRQRDTDRRAPAYGERAQPGDILGIESGGETTGIGDTQKDEDRRRERAERDIRDVPPDDDRDRDRR